MLQILRPTPNKQTGNPKSHDGYNAYDFSGKGDKNVYSPLFGKIIQTKNSETRNWRANQSGDPYKNDKRRPKLILEDYGNYTKIRHDIAGTTYYTLYAHLETNSASPVGTTVSPRQVIGKIGNSGNSSGRHLHFEVRDKNNKTIPVEFVDNVPDTKDMDKRQLYTDIYLGTRPNLTPSENEINFRLQENLNPVETIKSILDGDTKAREYWLDKWDVKENIDWRETSEQYKTSYNDLKELLKLPFNADTQEVQGAVMKLIEKSQVETKTIYKYQGRDYDKVLAFSNLVLILEK